MTKVLKSAKLNMFSKNANFVREIWFSRDKNESLKNSSAKKYKDDWNQKPIINPSNETTNLKEKKSYISN